MNEGYKEVYFYEYCYMCKYADLKESEYPCCECVSEPANIYSHKPVNFKEKEEKMK